MTVINIKLEPNADGRCVYYPNQIVRGSVELNLDHPKKIRAFYIVIDGTARCHWTERRTRSVGTGKNRRTESYSVHFEGKEVYLHSKTFLLGHEGAEATEIPPGLMTFTFAVALPPLIPESLSGANGDISYHAEAVLDIPWRFDKEIKTPFTVARCDNLNSYPELLMPLRLEEIKSFCCLCWKNGPCMMRVSIPCGGYSPGSTIPVSIEYDNRSTTDVELTRCKLVREMVYTSHTPERKKKTNSETIIQNNEAGVAKGKSASIESVLTIPSFMNNSNSNYCHVVEVSYYLEIEGVSRGCHSNLEIRFPITLGAIGVGQEMNIQGYSQQPITMPTAPLAVADDLPPTFDEAVGLAKKSEAEASMANPNMLGWNVPQNGMPSAPSAPDLPEKQ